MASRDHQRESSYAGGITGTTRRLLEHWYDVSQRDNRRFFFCQLEAIETLIWLAEVADLKAEGIEIPSDGGPFSRWCTKLATGTGKTVVMAMLIAWQTLNKAADKTDDRFSKNFLVLAPGLTVKSRLSVLVPESDGNYFDEFNIVPSGMIDQLRHGRVLVHNWHKLDWQTDEDIAKRRSVDKRGAKSDEAYAREVLGEMVSARDLIAINDEAHHAWRLTGDVNSLDVNRDEIDEAMKWIGDRQRTCGCRLSSWESIRDCSTARRPSLDRVPRHANPETHAKRRPRFTDQRSQTRMAPAVTLKNLAGIAPSAD